MLKNDASAQKLASMQAATDQDQLEASLQQQEEENAPPIPSQMLLRVDDLKSFYLSPYLSCAECNAVSFINSDQLQKALIADVGGDSGSLD